MSCRIACQAFDPVALAPRACAPLGSDKASYVDFDVCAFRVVFWPETRFPGISPRAFLFDPCGASNR